VAGIIGRGKGHDIGHGLRQGNKTLIWLLVVLSEMAGDVKQVIGSTNEIMFTWLLFYSNSTQDHVMQAKSATRVNNFTQLLVF